MIKSKLPSDTTWKDLAAKHKVKDNGLAKALEKLKRIDDDDHDEAAKVLDEIARLAGLLKKDKAVAAAPPALKLVTEIGEEAQSVSRGVAKANAEHDRAQKAKAEAERKAAQGAGDEDDDEIETPELLTSKLRPLLKLVAKGHTMHALLAKSGKQVVVMLSRKPIPPARRKMLAEQLGGGSTKYYPGLCSLEAGATTFTLKSEVAGMAKLVKHAVLEQTGLRLNKIKCRGEDGDDEDDDDTAVVQAVVAGGEGVGEARDKASDVALDQGPGAEPDLPERPDLDDLSEELVLAENFITLWNTTLEEVADQVEALRDKMKGDRNPWVQSIAEGLATVMQRFPDLDLSKLVAAAKGNDRKAYIATLKQTSREVKQVRDLLANGPLLPAIDANPYFKTSVHATVNGTLNTIARVLRIP